MNHDHETLGAPTFSSRREKGRSSEGWEILYRKATLPPNLPPLRAQGYREISTWYYNFYSLIEEF
jgi:hypothetical protein